MSIGGGGRFEAAGWLLFAISGVFFLIIAIRDSDPLVFWSSIAWLLGVISFAVSPLGPTERALARDQGVVGGR